MRILHRNIEYDRHRREFRVEFENPVNHLTHAMFSRCRLDIISYSVASIHLNTLSTYCIYNLPSGDGVSIVACNVHFSSAEGQFHFHDQKMKHFPAKSFMKIVWIRFIHTNAELSCLRRTTYRHAAQNSISSLEIFIPFEE